MVLIAGLPHAQEMRAIQDLPLATERCEILKKVLVLLNSLPPASKAGEAKAWWRLDAAKLWHIYRSNHRCLRWYLPRGTWGPFLSKRRSPRHGFTADFPKHIEERPFDDRV